MNAYKLASILFIIALVIVLLILGKPLLIPIIVAISILYLINILSDYFRKIKIGKYSLPYSLSIVASTITILSIVSLFIEIIASTVRNMIDAAPAYQENLENLLFEFLQFLKMDELPSLAKITEQFNLQPLIWDIGGGVSSFAGQLILIFIYVILLLIEQRFFQRKLKALVPEQDRYANTLKVLEHINSSIQTYIAVKTFTSFLTGVLSYIALRVIGVDFAVFWAFLIFIFNFIPSIGSIVATTLPAFFSVLQYESFSPFLVVVLAVGGVQLLVGNYIDPRLLGRSLNLSPFVVLFSLILWGIIWGVIGMFLSVPITVILMIILSQFKETQPFAVLLSEKGRILEEGKKEGHIIEIGEY